MLYRYLVPIQTISSPSTPSLLGSSMVTGDYCNGVVMIGELNSSSVPIVEYRSVNSSTGALQSISGASPFDPNTYTGNIVTLGCVRLNPAYFGVAIVIASASTSTHIPYSIYGVTPASGFPYARVDAYGGYGPYGSFGDWHPNGDIFILGSSGALSVVSYPGFSNTGGGVSVSGVTLKDCRWLGDTLFAIGKNTTTNDVILYVYSRSGTSLSPLGTYTLTGGVSSGFGMTLKTYGTNRLFVFVSGGTTQQFFDLTYNGGTSFTSNQVNGVSSMSATSAAGIGYPLSGKNLIFFSPATQMFTDNSPGLSRIVPPANFGGDGGKILGVDIPSNTLIVMDGGSINLYKFN